MSKKVIREIDGCKITLTFKEHNPDIKKIFSGCCLKIISHVVLYLIIQNKKRREERKGLLNAALFFNRIFCN